MGWLWLAVLGVAAALGLWRLGVPRTLWSFAGAALMLGASGYALQGQPWLAGHPTSAAARSGEVSAELSELRFAMFGRYTYADPFFTASDGLIRAGSSGSAVRVLLGGLNGQPDNAALWTALGQAYVANDNGQVSPPAKLAFARAMHLAPEHPGPPFFYGVALVEAGQLTDARRFWVRAYRLSPSASGYRREIGVRIILLDRFLAMQEAAERQGAVAPSER